MRLGTRPSQTKWVRPWMSGHEIGHAYAGAMDFCEQPCKPRGERPLLLLRGIHENLLQGQNPRRRQEEQAGPVLIRIMLKTQGTTRRPRKSLFVEPEDIPVLVVGRIAARSGIRGVESLEIWDFPFL